MNDESPNGNWRYILKWSVMLALIAIAVAALFSPVAIPFIGVIFVVIGMGMRKENSSASKIWILAGIAILVITTLLIILLFPASSESGIHTVPGKVN